MKQLFINTDGGSRGNPGPAAIGVAFFDETEKVEYLFRIFESHQEHIFSQKVDYLHH